jgi:hypothetical protein
MSTDCNSLYLGHPIQSCQMSHDPLENMRRSGTLWDIESLRNTQSPQQNEQLSPRTPRSITL